MQHVTLDRIEGHLADIDSLVETLIFIGEHAADEELPRARNNAMAILYIMAEIVRTTEKATASWRRTLH